MSSDANDPAAPSGGPAVLVLDASAFFRDEIGRIVAAAGHRCRGVADLAAAGDELADPELGVWIVDLESAEPDAAAALTRVRAERPALRTIALVRRSDADGAVAARRAGACETLPKPLHEETLRLAVARAVAGFEADAELARLRAAGASAAAAPDGTADADLDLARELCEAVVGEGDPVTLPARLLAILAARVPAAGASLYLLEPGGHAFVREAEWEGGALRDRPRLPAGRGLAGAAATTGVFVIAEAPETDPRFDPEVDRPAGDAAAPGGLVCLPLRFRRRTVGLVRVFPAAGVRPSLRTAEAAGAALSAALRSVLLYRSWRSSIDEVARIRRESAARPGAPGRVAPSPPSIE
jgi:DNA-binding response OmpR family regulator